MLDSGCLTCQTKQVSYVLVTSAIHSTDAYVLKCAIDLVVLLCCTLPLPLIRFGCIHRSSFCQCSDHVLTTAVMFDVVQRTYSQLVSH